MNLKLVFFFKIKSTDGDIDFILAPAVGSLTTASTGTSQGPSTSTIPGTCYLHHGNFVPNPYNLRNILCTTCCDFQFILLVIVQNFLHTNYTICVMLAGTKTATHYAKSIANSVLIKGKASLFIYLIIQIYRKL